MRGRSRSRSRMDVMRAWIESEFARASLGATRRLPLFGTSLFGVEVRVGNVLVASRVGP